MLVCGIKLTMWFKIYHTSRKSRDFCKKWATSNDDVLRASNREYY
jgi:hypothetical protein